MTRKITKYCLWELPNGTQCNAAYLVDARAAAVALYCPKHRVESARLKHRARLKRFRMTHSQTACVRKIARVRPQVEQHKGGYAPTAPGEFWA